MATSATMWAKQFGDDSRRSAERDKAQTQNTLMALFAEEASRQAPYVAMPARLAENNIMLQQQAAMQPLSLSPEDKAELEYQTYQRKERFRADMEAELERIKTDENIRENAETGGTSGNTISEPYQNADGDWYVDRVVAGKSFPQKLSPEQAKKMLNGE